MSSPNEPKYGTQDWFFQEYSHVNDDPWGLSWRPSQALRYQRVLTLVERISHPCRSVLDIGCATGDFTYLLHRRNPSCESLLGVDFVESAVARARCKYPIVKFAHESVFELGDVYAGQYDLLSCLEVLYYVEKQDQARALRSMKQVLQSGGYAIFSSYIGKPPYFTTEELVALVKTEFHVVSVDVLHLKLVSALEKIASRIDTVIMAATRDKFKSWAADTLRHVPAATVQHLERWSRVLKRATASHTIVLASRV